MSNPISSQNKLRTPKTTSSPKEEVGKNKSSSSVKQGSGFAMLKKLTECRKAAANFISSLMSKGVKHIKEPDNTGWKEAARAESGGIQSPHVKNVAFDLASNKIIPSNVKPSDSDVRTDDTGLKTSTPVAQASIENAVPEIFMSGDSPPASAAKPAESKRGQRLFGLGTDAHATFLAKQNDPLKNKLTPASLRPAPNKDVFVTPEDKPKEIITTQMPKPQQATVVRPNVVSLSATELGSAKMLIQSLPTPELSAAKLPAKDESVK